MNNMKWKCSVCGSPNVVKTAWVDPNDNNRFLTYYESTGYDFCKECGCTKDLVEADEIVWVCEECGGYDIEEKVWINPNTKEISYVEGMTDNYWCHQCDEHTYICLKEQFDKNYKDK